MSAAATSWRKIVDFSRNRRAQYGRPSGRVLFSGGRRPREKKSRGKHDSAGRNSPAEREGFFAKRGRGGSWAPGSVRYRRDPGFLRLAERRPGSGGGRAAPEVRMQFRKIMVQMVSSSWLIKGRGNLFSGREPFFRHFQPRWPKRTQSTPHPVCLGADAPRQTALSLKGRGESHSR